MNVIVEKGRKSQGDVMEDVEVAETEGTPYVPASANEKAELQKVLTDAGVEFSPQLGVKKLQALVDGLPKEDPEALVE